MSGDYHVADSNGLLWSLQPTFTRNPVTQFLMNYPGFSVTVQVLANGRVQASQTLRRVGPVPASTQTVRADGFASTMFLPTKLGLRRERGFMGGSQQANALAMERSWARMIEFINDPWHP